MGTTFLPNCDRDRRRDTGHNAKVPRHRTGHFQQPLLVNMNDIAIRALGQVP